MKNKGFTYILLGGVLLIWGLVFYKIFMGMDSGDDTSYLPVVKKIAPVAIQQQEEALVLLANYRDPFLGSMSKSISSTSVKTSSKPSASKVKKEEVVIDWSFIDYIGLVYNKETKKNIGLLAISGKEYMVNDKDVIAEVTVHKKTRDSIFVSYKGEKKWVVR